VLPIVEEHRRRNETTRERWNTMASHRARVMKLLADARGGTGSSLCILGAGNGNDIDLSLLAREFERVALVDLDDGALARAVERLDKDDRQRIELHGGIDLTDILSTLESWQTGQSPIDAELSEAIDAARGARTPGVGAFDVVASSCVLTQLIDSVYMGLASDHARCQELVMAVRNRHLEMIVELLNPGRVGVLVTDVVATETAPELATLANAQVPAAAVRWINERNFFTGANPYAIRDYYQGRRTAGQSVENVQVSAAWRWDIGAKQLAVSAVTFRRCG
jgi:hypothetical protein